MNYLTWNRRRNCVSRFGSGSGNRSVRNRMESSWLRFQNCGVWKRDGSARSSVDSHISEA